MTEGSGVGQMLDRNCEHIQSELNPRLDESYSVLVLNTNSFLPPKTVLQQAAGFYASVVYEKVRSKLQSVPKVRDDPHKVYCVAVSNEDWILVGLCTSEFILRFAEQEEKPEKVLEVYRDLKEKESSLTRADMMVIVWFAALGKVCAPIILRGVTEDNDILMDEKPKEAVCQLLKEGIVSLKFNEDKSKY